MSVAMFKDPAAVSHGVYALASTSATAGGSGDATEVDGATIDTASLPARPNGVVFFVPVTATLAATKTLTITANLQDSANGSTWADITDPAVLLTLTGDTGGSTETGCVKLGYDLSRARQYVRIQATPDLNATGTDTAVMGAGTAVFTGLDTAPAS